MISFLGFEYVSGGFPSNALTSKILPMSLPGNVDNVYQWEFKIESRQREPKKTEIKREIIAYEIALSRRRELKEEVKRKWHRRKHRESKLMIRSEGMSLPEGVSMSFNPNYCNFMLSFCFCLCLQFFFSCFFSGAKIVKKVFSFRFWLTKCHLVWKWLRNSGLIACNIPYSLNFDTVN